MKSKSVILIVDDIPENIQILLNSLKDDFIIRAATNGKQAFELANKLPLPDLIILDILMPDISGFEICQKLKKDDSTKDIPVVFISVLDDIPSIIKGFEVGGIDYISKPFDIREVSTRIKTHIELSTQNKKLKEKLNSEKIEKLKQKQLMIQQDKMAAMGEMLSMIAHQWKQPLSTVGTIVTSIKVNNSLHPETIDIDDLINNMDKIESLIKYLSETIDDFSNFFKASKKQKKLLLHDVIDKAVVILGYPLMTNNISLDNKQCNIEHEISIVENEFLHVIINIIKNSIDAAVENKTKNPYIHISCKEDKNTQTVIIEDNNGGIPEKLFKHIFEANFTTKNKKGTGLGLYMSKLIIENNFKGKISVQNNDVGAIFTIDIPKNNEKT